MALQKGLAFLRSQQEQIGSFGDRLPKLWLKEGDAARFWFIIGGEDVLVPMVHMEERYSTKKSKTYNQDVRCGRDILEDPIEMCSRCVAQQSADSKLKGPYPRAVFPVYVDVISHNYIDEKRTWKPVTRKGSTEPRFLQEVKAVWLFIPNGKVAQQLEQALEGDPLAGEDAETLDLLSCSWRLEVSGRDQQKVEKLSPEPVTAVPEAVRDLRKNPPDLMQIIDAEYGKLPSGARTIAAGSPALALVSSRPVAVPGSEGDPTEEVDLDGAGGADDSERPEIDL